MEAIAFSNRSFVLFLCLQALDVLTTVAGLRLGAREGSLLTGRILRLGTVSALLVSKAISTIVVSGIVALGPRRLVRTLNFWYAAQVAWNLGVIWLEAA